MIRRRDYGWIVTAYYNTMVKPPKKPNELAIEVWCGSDSIKDLEVKICNERIDIGTVTVTKLGK